MLPPGVIVTDADDACANTPDSDDEADDKWPADFDDNQVINVLDVNMTLPPYFGRTRGPGSEGQRPAAVLVDRTHSGRIISIP